MRRKPHSKLWAAAVASAVVAVMGGAAAAGVVVSEGNSDQQPPVAVAPIGDVAALAGTPTASEVALAHSASVQRDVAAVTDNTGVVVAALLPGQRVGPIRVPLAHLGSGDRSIWMYRTDRGKLCYGLTDFTAGCLDELPIGQPLNPIAGDPGDGGGAIVWGYAANNVDAVTVIGNWGQSAATVGKNAFFFQAPTGSTISSVVATLADGSTSSVAVPQPVAPR